jgi:thiol-disulfide isomerase/thioredoxin
MIIEVDKADPKLYSKFNSLLKDGNIIVLYYANWCGHCQSMKPEWDKFKKICKTNPKYSHLQVADVESEHIGNTNAVNEVHGFPTIKYYNKNSTTKDIPEQSIDYQDERVADKFINFANSNSLEEHVTEQLESNEIPEEKVKKNKKKKKAFRKKGNKKDTAKLRNLVFGNTKQNSKKKTKKSKKK